MLWLEADLIVKMSEHAARDYPQECLGLLLGRGRRVLQTLALPNHHAQPRLRVACHPRDYMRGEQLALAMGAEVCGFYHSHPDQPAVPSETDLREAAFSDWSYLILGVDQGLAGPPRGWKLRSDRKAFEEIEIIPVQGGAPCPKF